jgi:hypothetical protein
LATLFEQEKADEIEERDRVVALQPDSIPEKHEGTVVLAHPRAESRLEAPTIPHDPEQVESKGTELDLSEGEIRSALGEVKHRSQLEASKLAAASASDVTRASAYPPGKMEEEMDAMPTRAVALFPRNTSEVTGRSKEAAGERARAFADPASLVRRSLRRDEDALDPDTQDEPMSEIQKRALGTLDEESGPTHLPGFVDNVPKKRNEPQRTKPTPPQQGPARPAAPHQKSNTPSVEPVVTKAYGSLVPPSQGRAHRSGGLGKNAVVLVGLLALAILMGVGIGVIVASLKRQQPIFIEGESTPRAENAQISTLKMRLLTAKNEIDIKKTRGEAIPARAWELIGAAGTALISEDEASSRAAVEELEKLLSIKPAVAEPPSSRSGTREAVSRPPG